MTTYPVSSKTEVLKLAGAISKVIQKDKPVILQAVGAAAVNQAMKAIAVTRQMVGERGLDLFCIPSFQNIFLAGESRTMIEIKVYEQVKTKEKELPIVTNTILQ